MYYLWDMLEIYWNKVTFNDNKIELPTIVTIKI